ncbi:hypothetical protein, partial [Bacillus cereus]|uniref:hypothetical protein n=1 Tax=Bacillus cereus TaxID=1396 RepID=UPI001C4C1294
TLPKMRKLFTRIFSNGAQYASLLQTELKTNHLYRYRKILILRNHYEGWQIDAAMKQAVL